jgi:predicted porin
MKKTLIAIAALAAFSVSYAQSSVTLFGVIDTGVTYGSASPGSNLWQLSSGEWSGSRIGFRGREDLGGGLFAGFHLEAGFDSDSGVGKSTSENNVTKAGGDGIGFNRRATISLMGSWGELRLGRDKNPLYDGFNDFDPFGGDTVAAAYMWQAGREMYDNTTAVKRVSNSIGYLLPKGLGGFYGRAMVATGENSDPSNLYANDQRTAYKGDGDYAGFYAGYDNNGKGPFTAGVSYGKTQYGYNIAKTKGGNLTNWQTRRHLRLRRRQALGPVFERHRGAKCRAPGAEWQRVEPGPHRAHGVRQSGRILLDLQMGCRLYAGRETLLRRNAEWRQILGWILLLDVEADLVVRRAGVCQREGWFEHAAGWLNLQLRLHQRQLDRG